MFEELFCSILELEPSQLDDQVSQASIGTWSSLAHINLVTALEEAYGVSFTTQEILAMKSVGNARTLLREKGVAL